MVSRCPLLLPILLISAMGQPHWLSGQGLAPARFATNPDPRLRSAVRDTPAAVDSAAPARSRKLGGSLALSGLGSAVGLGLGLLGVSAAYPDDGFGELGPAAGVFVLAASAAGAGAGGCLAFRAAGPCGRAFLGGVLGVVPAVLVGAALRSSGLGAGLYLVTHATVVTIAASHGWTPPPR